MNLKKAREIIQLNIKEAGKTMPPDVLTALKIHVEAVYRLEQMRTLGYDEAVTPLPSEMDG